MSHFKLNPKIVDKIINKVDDSSLNLQYNTAMKNSEKSAKQTQIT